MYTRQAIQNDQTHYKRSRKYKYCLGIEKVCVEVAVNIVVDVE